ncbi:hypothetical protein HDV00_003363 [Rhizophlyctis rosea]|nr:hypothetical protein HDV00_003363 [Rhizophlyctis rosea]
MLPTGKKAPKGLGRPRNLHDAIFAIPAIDAHCHPLLLKLDNKKYAFQSIASEAKGEALQHATSSLVFKRAVREISTWLGVNASVENILDARKCTEAVPYVERIVKASKIHGLLIDDGLSPNGQIVMSLEETAKILPVKRILRLETTAEAALREVCADSPEMDFATFKKFENRFLSLIKDDSVDLDLRHANPLLLRLVFEAYKDVKFVLLHVYPFTREAAYLASVYENVYVDFGLADLVLSADGQKATIRDLLHLAPTSKIQFSTDAHFHPEGLYLASKWGREALAQVLMESVKVNELDVGEAIQIAWDILFHNANDLYRLGWVATQQSETAGRRQADFGVIDAVKEQGVKAVRVTWVDSTNLTRTKLIPIAKFPSIAEKGVAVVSAVLAFPMMWDVVQEPTESISVTRDINLVPDLRTLRQLPYHSAHAVVLGNFVDGDGVECAACPRAFLHRQLDRLQTDHGLTLSAGFEIEFLLLEKNADGTPGVPVDGTNYAEWGSLEPRIATVLDEIVEALEEQGCEVELFHPEAAPGQFEVVLKFCDAKEMVDRVVLARQTIYNIPTLHGLKASFVPKSWEHHDDNGADGIGEETRHFMAGIYTHLQSLVAITTPSVNSFARLQPGCWAGAFHCWGLANKEAPLRALKDNFEYKAMDGTANPYLALGALIAAGIHGLEAKLDLPPPTHVDPATLPADKAPPRLPTDLKTALGNLADDNKLRELMGDEIVKAFLAVKKAEVEAFEGKLFEEIRDAVMRKY